MGSQTDPPARRSDAALESSPGQVTAPPLAIGSPPPAVEQLPETYGVPALQLLVVDPGNVFVSWEVTPDQLAAAQEVLGPGFGERKPYVDIALADEQDATLARAELFGDVGRWFIEVPPAGRAIVARLYFANGGGRLELLQAGPVDLPRTMPVEPEQLEELFVAYTVGPGGRLSLAGVTSGQRPTPPQLDLARHPLATPGTPGSVPGSAPSSAGGWGATNRIPEQRDD